MTTTTAGGSTIVELDDAPVDPERLAEMFAANGPYWNQARYLSAAGMASQMTGHTASQMTGAAAPLAAAPVGVPWYRQDWALDGRPLVDGADDLLANAAFVGAARRVFGGSVVRPHTLYANVQLPAVGTDHGHTDVPEFRGATRDRLPVALLHVMNRSGLFARWQLDICTAVTWLWSGPRGDFVLWADGPDRSPTRVTPPLTGRAVVADNDRLAHAVGAFDVPTGPASELLTPTSEVHVAGERFELRHGDAILGSWPHAEVRCSLSWKAYVFHDEDAAAVADDHRDDLDDAAILARFAEAFATRGVVTPEPLELDDSLITAAAALWPKRVPVPE